ncbi:truncated integrase/recombinase [Azoarcus olearius]|uniref:Truncated integrase/recombinase n=1 Tax=Azoarcus sp. (strain BH72) TaxID=418699 RepID=A1KBY4_AZOSB|nr:truncated integrase/recombinase [Azoarcus olearius]
MTAVRLLDQVRARIRYKHYSLGTEQQYVYWVRTFLRFHGVRHPREMGATEVEQFLSWLATDRKVAVSTHKQALSALLFLYRNVLGVDLPWLSEFERPKTPVRLPSVLSGEEVSALLDAMEGSNADLARLVYGTGMRLREALRLRVKDVDFQRRLIVVREGKGNKDRIVMLPHRCSNALREQLHRAYLLWAQDRADGTPGGRCPSPSRTNTRVQRNPGHGSGSGRRRRSRSIRARACPGGITCTKSACSVRCAMQ